MEKWKDKRIGILMGGVSSEREISLQTGTQVSEALRGLGYSCVDILWQKENMDKLTSTLLKEKVDVVWNALHGTLGEDGAIQGLLRSLEIPGTGSGILASAMAMDKAVAKKIFEYSGVPTPRWTFLTSHLDWSLWPLPLVLKPAAEGSSVGVSVVFTPQQLSVALTFANSYEGEIIVEDFIEGDELHIGILGEEVLGSIEVRPAEGFYDYEAKYRRADTQYLVPTLAPTRIDNSEEIALSAHRALGCEGHSRVDLRVSKAGQPYVLEVNTLPGMTARSLLPKIAANKGIDYPSLCERILNLAKV